ncbi:ureidoglycolate lyase [Oceanisphaera litoralis]|uniref:ureidoglycolate lyase n=1 Tax=Oceanisphaera litoralis TaxID=225144 RepID=UPI00195B368B|nr:ureidoglycolate lyase [Oceanisphaera litoralis]MBM7455397.1 ureidoglycolate lyase [Oceanisphaera litoralis]
MLNTLKIEPLTKEAFAPFGDVIESEGRDYFMINNGSTRRYHQLADVQLDEQGQGIISIFRTEMLDYPLQLKMLERHPFGSQVFMPLFGHDYLVVVAPVGDGSMNIDPSTVRVFRASGRQGVNYHRGVWHHPLMVLRDHDEFLVVDRSGPGNNCDEVYFDESVQLTIALD